MLLPRCSRLRCKNPVHRVGDFRRRRFSPIEKIGLCANWPKNQFDLETVSETAHSHLHLYPTDWLKQNKTAPRFDPFNRRSRSKILVAANFKKFFDCYIFQSGRILGDQAAATPPGFRKVIWWLTFWIDKGSPKKHRSPFPGGGAGFVSVQNSITESKNEWSPVV